MSERTHLRSGELARLAGVSTDSLRHYERMKVLAAPRRSSGNYRLYPPEAADRVRLIRRALAVGFSLPELAKILRVRDEGGAPCRQVRGMLEEKLHLLEERIADLSGMRDHLCTVLADWDQRLARTPHGRPARLLDALTLPEGTKHEDDTDTHPASDLGRDGRPGHGPPRRREQPRRPRHGLLP